MSYRHILDVDSLSEDEFLTLVGYGVTLPTVDLSNELSAALLFEKPSNRTRHSMETAIHKLNGFGVYVRQDEVDMGKRESIEDVTRTLACYHSVIAARVFNHESLIKMCQVLDKVGSSTAVINLLSDYSHPQQAIADVLTISDELAKRNVKFSLNRENLDSNSTVKVVYVGDFNNVTVSLLKALTYLNCKLHIFCPLRYGPSDNFYETHPKFAQNIIAHGDLDSALSEADVVYTDTWVSMGEEDTAKTKLKAFEGLTLSSDSLTVSKESVIFMHCLPAHRGFEVTDDLMESSKSVVFQQAAMRQNAALATFIWLFKDQASGGNKWP